MLKNDLNSSIVQCKISFYALLFLNEKLEKNETRSK